MKSVIFGVLFTAAAGLAYAGPDSAFDDKTALVNQTVQAIDGRVRDVEALKAEAVSQGKTLRASCIEEKLKRAKNNATAAHTVMDGWALGQNNPAYAQRSIDRVLLLQVYAMIYVEEARSCLDAEAAGQALVSQLHHDSPEPPTGPTDPVRPPTLQRPPLASPF